jgi:choline dehydrogenase-like flavoprotein
VRDVIIIGSGFGAAVMAARIGRFLAAAAPERRVLVLEKGDDPTGLFDPDSSGGAMNAQGNRFRHTLAPDYLSGVADLYTDPLGELERGAPTMTVAAGRGIGGGSNLYCGVSLRCPRDSFDQVRGGRRLWPSRYSRAALDPYYQLVEERLRVRRLSWTDDGAPHWALTTKRDLVFAEGCRRIGATAVPLKVATDRDANEGWWSQGQRFQGRQGLIHNYLLDARDAGVEFHSGCEVQEIEPDGAGYIVRGVDRRGGESRSFEEACRVLVVAAGSVASTGLLLRSRNAFAGGFGAALGKHLSGNGDYGVTGRVGPGFSVEGHKGKPMASFCPSFWRGDRFILIPFYAEPLYLALGRFTTVLPAHHPEAVGRGSTGVAEGAGGRPVPDWGAGYKERLQLFTSRMLTMGCLALDECEGEIRLGASEGSIEVVWRETDPATEARWSAAVDVMRRLYQALGGELFLDGYRKDGSVYTAHPLGGCRMAAAAGDGVVDADGEVFGNRNMFVVDGAIIPSALGVNPSLTIAAVAESIADRLVRGDGLEPLLDRLSA